MGTIECWSVIGLKGLKTYRLLLIIQSTLKCTSLGLASNTTYQPRVRSLQGNLRLRSLHQGEVWVFPVMTEWTRLISYLLYANSIKTLEVIFNIPLWAYWVIQGHVHWTKTNLMMWSIPQDTLLWQWDNFCLYYVKIVAKLNHFKKIS